MTPEEQLVILKSMIGNDDSDEVLLAYLSLAGRKIINRAFPFKRDATEVPVEYTALQVEIAAYMLNKRGAEGETSHSENGINRQYESGDVPESMLKSITPYCGVIK